MHADVHPASLGERPAALDLMFRNALPEERPGLVDRASQMLETGELDPRGLLVASIGSDLVGTMLCTPTAGAVGMIWPPRCIQHASAPSIEDQLVRHALSWLGRCRVKVVQALLRPEEDHVGEPLLRNGFRHVTTLLVLRQDSRDQLVEDQLTLRFQALPQAKSTVFADTLEQTYVGSQDCPEASGLRTIEEVLAGHRAQGVFDPAMWWLVRDASKPVGVLLINAVRDESVWEVVYMGIVPEARGRGYGRQLLNFALREARSAGVGRVELSVDSRNIYACQIYRLLGFELVNIRLVYLAALGPQQLS